MCDDCRNAFKIKYHRFKVKAYPALALYDYDEWIKKNLYQLKGCYDIELAPVFLEKMLLLLKIRYKGYNIVPVPSSDDDDKERGFNHVKEIFSSLKFKFLPIIKKKIHYKQSDQHIDQRGRIKDILFIKENVDLYGKHILIVDDVFTTGNTIKAMVDLVEQLHPKKIKILLIAKTTFVERRNV